MNNLVLHHLFQSNNEFYLFNSETLNSSKIEKKEAKTIVKTTHLNYPLSSSEEESIFRLGLINTKDNYYKKDPKFNTEIALNHISINVSQNCNMSCSYCYGKDGEYGNRSLMVENDMITVLDEFLLKSKKNKHLRINFFGGEPLLNLSLIKKAVLYIKDSIKLIDKKVSFSISTNGLLLNKKGTLEFLKKYNFSVQISLDGDKELSLKQRPLKSKRDYFEELLDNIQLAKKASLDILIRSTALNEENYDKITKFIESLNITKFEIKTASHSDTTHQSINIKKKHYLKRANKTLNAIRRKDDSEIDLTMISLINSLEKRNKKYFGCSAGKTSLASSTKGDYYICHRFVGDNKYKIGNKSNPKLNKEVFAKMTVNQIPKCSICWAKYLCGGGCMHENKVANNDIFEPSIKYCNNVKSMYEAAIFLYCNLTKVEIQDCLNSKIIPGRV